MAITRREMMAGAGAAALTIGGRPAFAAQAPAIEIVGEMRVPPGNVTVTGEGRVVASAHPFYQSPISATVIDPDGSQRDIVIREGGEVVPVLSVRSDTDETVLMMNGARRRIYRVDARTGETKEVIDVRPNGLIERSALNDIAVDPLRRLLFVTDPADGVQSALVVISTTDGSSRRVLQGHASLRRQDVPFVIDGVTVGDPQPDGTFRGLGGGANPITIDPEHHWVYFGAMSGDAVWRITTDDLADEALAPEALAERVERVCAKSASAGMTVDDAGNVYVSDPGARGIGTGGVGKPYRVLVQDDRLLDFPDGLATGYDGFVYVCSNGLYRRAASHRATPGGGPPFYLTRFRALGPTAAGR